MKKMEIENIEHDIFIKKIQSVINSFSIMPPDSNWIHKKENKRTTDSLVYILSGEAMLCPDENNFHVKANDIVFIPSNKSYSSHGIAYPFYYIQISFKSDINNIVFCDIIKDKNEYYLKKFKVILEKWQEKNLGYILECKSMLYSLIYELLREQVAAGYPKKHYEIIKLANEYIQKNIKNPYLSINELISCTNIGGTYFRKIFKDFYGVTPSKYINNFRIILAKEYLKTTDLPISKIAEETGFLNIYYFSNSFKESTGLSPLNYRKKHKTINIL